MLGLMQDRPLLVSSLIEYADTVHGDTEVISRCSDGMHRGTWRSTHKRARQLAKALLAGGIRVLEVTLRTPAALDVIRAMKTVAGAIVGALWLPRR